MKTTPNIQQFIRRLTALLMLPLLFSSAFIQLIHTHDTASAVCTTADDDATGVADECSVCEHYLHQADASMLYVYPPQIAAPLPATIVTHDRTYAGIYKFTLQGFSNKGPPHSLSIA